MFSQGDAGPVIGLAERILAPYGDCCLKDIDPRRRGNGDGRRRSELSPACNEPALHAPISNVME
jgi:hypothetical protein